MCVNWKLSSRPSPNRTTRAACFTKRIIAIPVFFPPLSLSAADLSGFNSGRKLRERIPSSAGMVKLRNFSSLSDVSGHSGARRAAFTRILLCCLDTYISRLIAWPKKGKMIVTEKFHPVDLALHVSDLSDLHPFSHDRTAFVSGSQSDAQLSVARFKRIIY